MRSLSCTKGRMNLMQRCKRSFIVVLFLCCITTAFKGAAQNLADVMTSADWSTFFPHRFNPDDRTGAGTPPATPAKDFYSYANFAEAVRRMGNIKIIVERRCATNAYRLTRVDKTTGASLVFRTDADFNISPNMIVTETVDYASFAGEGDLAARKRELMAFLANISQETTGGWPTAPGGPYAWGLYFREEVGFEGTNNIGYRDESNAQYPPAPGKSYHGRGPIQLSYNYNYGQASEFIFGDKNVLLANPEKVIQDGVIAFETGIWFWMTQQYPKPSCHEVMIPGKWTPTAEQTALNLKPGFGATVNIINGGVECGGSTENAKVLSRIGHYQRYTGLKQVSLELNGGNNAVNCGCANMGRFAIDAAECSKVTSLSFTAPANGILNVSSLSPVTLTVAKNDPRSEITQVFVKIDGQRLAGTSVQWTPSAYKAYTATAVGIRSGKDSVVTTTTFAIWNSQTFEGCSGLPLWNANKVYDKPNNIVRYNNTIYRNQWWAGATDVPGSNTTWAVVGACNGAAARDWEAFNAGIAGQAATVAEITATLVDKAADAATEPTVYPNPLVKDGTLSVKLAKYDAAKPVQVTILDVSKKVVAFHKGNAKVLNFSTANLPAGFYILVITNGNNTSTKKIVIQ